MNLAERSPMTATEKRRRPKNKPNAIQYLKGRMVKKNQDEKQCSMNLEKNQENEMPWKPTKKSISGMRIFCQMLLLSPGS